MISREAYQEKKKKLISQVKLLKNNGTLALNKKTSNLFRHRNQKQMRRIDVRKFNNVIDVDTKNGIAEVEGMTTYDELVRETLRKGFLPTVVPQLKSITIGGATTGVGIESSSFKFGLVHETILEVEIILSDGSVVVATPTNEHKELFFGFPNSYGTLGYALKLKVKIIPAKKYVRLEHIKFSDDKEFFEQMQKICDAKKVDFVDGTIFHRKEMYITTGTFVDRAPYTSDYTYMNIFFKSLQKRSKDYLKVKDYIWRWDTDWFWCSKHFFVQNPLVRFFVGRKRLTSVTYSKIRSWHHKQKFLSSITRLFGRKESVVQDVEIPVENCSAFMDFFHKVIKIKPVWVCPLRTLNKKVSFPLYPMDADKLYVNFGFWDVIPTTKKDGFYNRVIEKQVKSLSGKKSLYSTSFYGEKEFWELYNKKEYVKLKKKYDPDKNFLDLYEKCVQRK